MNLVPLNCYCNILRSVFGVRNVRLADATLNRNGADGMDDRLIIEQ